MTRKTTKFSRKRLATGGLYNGAEWLNTISRCRPYTTETLPGAVVDGSTQEVADKAIEKAREAFARLKAGATPHQDQDDFDRLVHALSVSCVRAGEIAGPAPESNELLPPLIAGNKALRAVLTRRQRFGKWQMLVAEIEAVDWAVEIYETILQASSPAQMTVAMEKHMKWIDGQKLEEITN
jgi:1,2-phenylacetyl-CoA epoxidase PaaB subunit